MTDGQIEILTTISHPAISRCDKNTVNVLKGLKIHLPSELDTREQCFQATKISIQLFIISLT